MKKTSIIFLVFLMVAILTSLFPYPIFSKYTNISKNEAFQINNFHETELLSNTSQKIEILDLNFAQTNAIFPLFSSFEIIDMTTNSTFVAKRTGGKNHFDIQPVDYANAKTVVSIKNQINPKNTSQNQTSDENAVSTWNWQRFPVLVKINDFAYIPASIAYYPHGHTSPDNFLCGHLCLHFCDSRTDGTERKDDFHQKCIAYAKKHARQFINENLL